MDALSTYETIFALIEKVQRKYYKENSKLFLRNMTQNTCKNSILAALLAYQDTQDEKYIEKAFEFVEKSKVSILMQAINESMAKQFAGDSGITLSRHLLLGLVRSRSGRSARGSRRRDMAGYARMRTHHGCRSSHGRRDRDQEGPRPDPGAVRD